MRFTIRDVLLTTVIFGLAIGWALDRYSLNNSLNRWQDRANGAMDLFEHATEQDVEWVDPWVSAAPSNWENPPFQPVKRKDNSLLVPPAIERPAVPEATQATPVEL